MSKVLIVDDDDIVLTLMVEAMKLSNIDVYSVMSGKGAIAMLHANHYDLLVVDLFLDEVSGFDVIDQAIAKDETINILVVSGGNGDDNTEELLNEALMSGADAVLEKPFSPDELVRTVKALLR